MVQRRLQRAGHPIGVDRQERGVPVQRAGEHAGAGQVPGIPGQGHARPAAAIRDPVGIRQVFQRVGGERVDRQRVRGCAEGEGVLAHPLGGGAEARIAGEAGEDQVVGAAESQGLDRDGDAAAAGPGELPVRVHPGA